MARTKKTPRRSLKGSTPVHAQGSLAAIDERPVIDKIEKRGNAWLRAKATIENDRKVAEQEHRLLLAAMQAEGVTRYVLSDGTPVSRQTTEKVRKERKQKPPKRSRRPRAEKADTPDRKPTSVRRAKSK